MVCFGYVRYSPMSVPHLNPIGSGREEIRIITVCPMCQAKYHPLASRVVAEQDDKHLLYLECRQCGSAVVALVTADDTGVDSIGMLTDLSSQEVLEIANVPAVTADDVIELHQAFNQPEYLQLILRRKPVPV